MRRSLFEGAELLQIRESRLERLKSGRLVLSLAGVVAMLIAWAPGASADDLDPCHRQYQEKVGNCALEAQRSGRYDSADFSYFKTCADKYDAELKACLNRGTGSSGAPQIPPAGCAEAKENVDWVFRDAGARNTFARNRGQGKAPFDSVYAAQGHNPSAQKTLAACMDWVISYLATLRLPSPIGSGGGTPKPPVAPLRVDGGGCANHGGQRDDYEEQKEFFGGPPNSWKVVVSTGNLCNRPVQATFCVRFPNAALHKEITETHILPVNPPSQIFAFFAINSPEPGYSLNVQYCEIGEACPPKCL
jgi:hypothetical protein